MKVRDIEARRAALVEGLSSIPNSSEIYVHAKRKVDFYESVLDAIAKSGVYPAAAQAKAALGRPTNTKPLPVAHLDGHARDCNIWLGLGRRCTCKRKKRKS